VALEPNSAIGLHQLGICSVYKGDFDFGLDALGLAQRYQPFDEELIADFADGLIHAGQTAAAIDKLAPLLDAPFALTDHTLWVAASTFYLAGRYEDAIDTLSRLNSKDTAHQLRAACHAMLSQFDEARRFVALTREILPEFSIAARLRAVPFRLADDLEHYRRGLRLAGFE
jgi:tetratricopeptide (TPR) repeat protein